MIENVRSIAIDGHPLLKCGHEDRRAYTGAIRNQQGAALLNARPAPAALFQPRHHTANLPRFPYPAAGRGWDAALVECHCDPVPRGDAARLYLRDDRSQLNCPRVGTRNKGLAAGLAGLRLLSNSHGFQGKEKPRADGGLESPNALPQRNAKTMYLKMAGAVDQFQVERAQGPRRAL
jgi:hypothetical protein